MAKKIVIYSVSSLILAFISMLVLVLSSAMVSASSTGIVLSTASGETSVAVADSRLDNQASLALEDGDFDLLSKLDALSAYPLAYIILFIIVVIATVYFILKYVYLRR